MNDVVIGIKLTGDSKGLTGEVRLTRQALQELNRETDSGKKAANAGRQAAEDYARALKKQYDTVGMATAEVKKYEVAQLAATDAEKAAMSATIDATAAAERKLQMAEKLGRTLGGLILTAVQAGAALAALVQKESIQAAMEAEQSYARLQAILKATGHQAGLTAADIEKVVDQLTAATQFDDESLRDAAATMLIFGNISKEQFTQAMTVAASLAATLRTDLNSAVLMIGKALQDPEEGLTALQRAGVRFNDTQKDMIKDMVESGRQADAMTFILEELKKRGIDGVAESMNSGLTKAWSDNKKALNELFETIGQTQAVGGTAKNYFTGLTAIMRDLQAQIDGTSSRLANFFKSEQFLGTPTYKLLRALGAIDDPYEANAREKKPAPKEAPFSEQLAAQDGKFIKGQQDRIDLERKRAAEAAKNAEKEAQAYERITKAADDYIASLNRQLAATGATTEQKIMLEAATRAMTLSTEKERIAFLDSAKELAHKIQLEEDDLALKKRLGDEYKKIQEIEAKRTQGLQDQIDAQQRELDGLIAEGEQLGKTREEIERGTLAKLEAALAAKDFTTSTYEEIAALEKRIDIQRRIVEQVGSNDTARRQIDLMDVATSRAASFFMELGRGRGAVRELWEDVKGLAAEMAALFLKRYILNLAVSGTTLASGAVNAATGGAGSDSIAGAALNGVGSAVLGAGATWALGTTGAGALGATAGGAFAQGAMGMGAGVWAPGSAGAMGASLSGVYSALAAIPVWGWIAMAVIAIGAWIAGKHKGGDKFGGSFMGSFDSSGDMTGTPAVPGSDNGRFFTPNQADPALRDAVRSFANGFYSQLAAFGGTTGGMSFGLGLDHDPRGTAQSRVSSMVTDAQGRVIYSNLDRSMDDKEVPEQIALEIRRGILAGLQNSQLEEGIANILKTLDAKTASSGQIDNVIKLATAYKALGDTIAALEGGPMVAFQQQLDAMDQSVETARLAFADALEGDDAGAVLAAEQQLAQAIMSRYQAEISMVMQLKRAIEDLQQQAYEFSLAMAQRINAVGGNLSVPGLAMSRANDLRGSIGGDFDPAGQFRRVQQYVGAIDTWYQARRAAIERDMQAQQAHAQAQAAAVQRNHEVRIGHLTQELEVAQQWAGVLDRASQMIEQMRLTGVNPLSAIGRLDLAREDAAAARATFLGSTGAERVDAANRYLEALQRELGLLPEALQRPSPEYQAIYNEIISQLSEVQGVAKTESQRAIELQEQLVMLQAEANSSAAAAASFMQGSNAALDALDEEARGYYTWAMDEGERLYTLQIQQHQEQLNAITGGMDVELFIAQKNQEAVNELRAMRTDINNWAQLLANGLGLQGAPGPGGAGAGPGGGTTGLERPERQKAVLVVDGRVLGEVLMPYVDSRVTGSLLPQIKRGLSTA